MAARKTLSTRWVTVILVAALVCSVGVVWGLIQITGQSPASSSTPSSSASGGSASASSGSSEPASPDSSTVDTADPPDDPSAGQSSGAPASSAPLTPLPGSGLALPDAWTGTAEMTITVLGRCAATGGKSSYTRHADLALQGPVQGIGPYDDPNPFSMTLGITPAGIPGLSIYSASTDQSGFVQRTWWLTTGALPDGRTAISGVLIDDQPVSGVLPPNLLVDNETDLQPCETGGTVRVARTLAAGSTIKGWVSANAGQLELSASTADGERAVSALITLTRAP